MLVRERNRKALHYLFPKSHGNLETLKKRKTWRAIPACTPKGHNILEKKAESQLRHNISVGKHYVGGLESIDFFFYQENLSQSVECFTALSQDSIMA